MPIDLDINIKLKWIEYKEFGELHLKVNKSTTHLLCNETIDLKINDTIIPFFKLHSIIIHDDFISIYILLYYYTTVDEYILK